MSSSSSPPSTSSSSSTQPLYSQILSTLLSQPHAFYLTPSSPPRPIIPSSSSSSSSITKCSSNQITIASLSLHPVLESALHLLNRDLASAHFLLRHAQAPPAHASMFLHGVLHRMEGDVDNARAWYGDVCDTDVFKEVWTTAGTDGWRGFLERVERWHDRTRARRERAGGRLSSQPQQQEQQNESEEYKEEEEEEEESLRKSVSGKSRKPSGFVNGNLARDRSTTPRQNTQGTRRSMPRYLKR